MPFAQADGLRLYYELAGSGDPVVLIAGLGADAHFWYKQLPALARRFQVLTFDNRDSSRSDKVEASYTVGAMAGDVERLLGKVGLNAAHVVGASLGGFIAQEFALAYPHRVRKLVLCCTSFGGPHALPIPPQTLAVMMNRSGDAERDLRSFLPVQIATDYLDTHAAEVSDYVAWRVAHPQPPAAYQRQLMAAVGHDTEERLSVLRMPVLILHGDQDRVVPPGNAALLGAKIPGARVHIVSRVGHLLLWEAAEEANRMLIEFLSSA